MRTILAVADAFPGFVLDVSVRCLVIGFLIISVSWILRARNAAWEQATWRLTLAAMLVLPIASLAIPPIHISTAVISTPVMVRPQEASPPSTAARSTSIPLSQHRVNPARAVANPFPWALLALASYVVIAIGMLARILLGWWLIHRSVRNLETLKHPRFTRASFGMQNPPEFRSGNNVVVPVTFGWRKPVILLPANWSEWPEEKLELVLAHELSHIDRSDYLVRLLSTVNRGLYWFHPLSWWVAKRLAETAEYLSDDAAISSSSIGRERYAELLTEFTGILNDSLRRFRMGIAMSTPALGSSRIGRILDEQRPLCLMLAFRHKLIVASLGIPALIFVAAAQTGPVRPQTPSGPTQQTRPVARHPRKTAPPMFSPAYVEALQGVLQLEPSDVAALEARLSKDPDDFGARLKLIAYTMRADRAGLPESQRQRADLVLWLVEHHPNSEILASPYGTLAPGDLTPEQRERAMNLWASETRASTDARFMWNAANFYRQLDRQLYIAALERAVSLGPDNQNYALTLGLTYAGAILTIDPQSMYRDPGGPEPLFARHASEMLERTQNAFLIEPAVRLLQSEYNRSLMMGKANVALGQLAHHHFERAQALDPDVDADWIYPTIDPKMIGMMAPGAPSADQGAVQFEAAAKQIRTLPPNAFPELPVPIQTELNHRGCMIPQPASSGEARMRNVVKGEFFEKGKTAWAVLCSAKGSSSILVFHGGDDSRPEQLAGAEDKNFLQGAGDGRIVYSREIQPADRKFILDHYRAYGGPEPPPIDHQGIDDAFLGKASVTHYWYGGEWRHLTGAD